MSQPRRLTRAANKTTNQDLPSVDVTQAAPSKKRPLKPPHRVSKDSVEYLLTNTRSKLCTVDMKKIFSAETWAKVPPEAQARLVKLLPETAFTSYEPRPHPSHPSLISSPDLGSSMDVETSKTPAGLNPSFMNCEYLQAAAGQFQDQIFSGHFTPKHRERLSMYDEALKNGSSHALWKDIEWEKDHAGHDGDDDDDIGATAPAGNGIKGKAKADASKRTPRKQAGASLPPFSALVDDGLIRLGDMLIYSRNDSKSQVQFSKELIVQRIDPNTRMITFLMPNGAVSEFEPSIASYPAMIIDSIPALNLTPELGSATSRGRTTEDFDDSPSTHTAISSEYVTISCRTTAGALESHLWPLCSSDPLPSQTEASAAKCFTLWRFEDPESGIEEAPHGGREMVNTLHYIMRSCSS